MQKQEQPYQRFETLGGGVRIRRRRSPSLSRHREMVHSTTSPATQNLSLSRLELYAEEYLSDCSTAHSSHTVAKRRINITRLLRYLRQQ